MAAQSQLNVTQLKKMSALSFPEFTPTFPQPEWSLPQVLEHQAATIGNRPFIKWEDEGPEYTYAQTNARANQLARGLQKLGIKHGDCAVLFMPNSLDYLFTWFTLNKLGAIEAPINVAYKGKFLEHQTNICKAETIVADIAMLDAVRDSIEQMPGIKRVIVWSRDGRLPAPMPQVGACQVVAFSSLIESDDTNLGIKVGPQDTGAIMFTSGTTGLSKGVMMPHGQLYLFAEINVRALELTGDDTYMTGFPLFHANAQLLTTYPTMIAGMRVVLYERFSATQWVDRLHSSGATVTNSLGVVLPFVFAQPATPRDGTHKLRRILSAPTPYGILDEFKARFNVHKFVEGFGQTEICCPIMTPLSQADSRPKGAAGLLLTQFFEVRLVDQETDMEVPRGEVGELMLRHKTPWTINSGYISMPEKTAEAWRNLWFHTGDGVRQDEEGWFYFVDRLKDALRRRGENISSYEVEGPIREHPAVAEVAVVAVPAEEGGEDEVKACVILTPDQSVTPEALIEWCDGRIPGFAVPRFIEFVDEFPKTPSEKVRKNVLRAAGINAATWDRVKAGVLLKEERDKAAKKKG